MILFLDPRAENQKPLKWLILGTRHSGVWPGRKLLCNKPRTMSWAFKSSSCVTWLKIKSKLKYIVIPRDISGEIVNDETQLHEYKTLKISRKVLEHIFDASE